jgi:NADH-quinone oxidoreductase subunit A
MHSYFPILFFFAGGLVFTGLGLLISRILQTQKPNPEKNSPYECGEESVSNRSRFNLRFFLAAVVFILMEVELVLMAPVILNRSAAIENDGNELSSILRFEMLIFLLLLGAGFMLALGMRYFDWEKPVRQPAGFQGPVPDFVYEQYNLDREKEQHQGR